MAKRSSIEISDSIASISQPARTLFFRTLACREYIQRVNADIIASAQCHWPDDSNTVPGHMAHPAQLHENPDAKKIAAISATHAALVESPEFAEAEKIMRPLLEELAEAEAREESERIAVLEARKRLQQAQLAARERLQEKMDREMERDPDIRSAMTNLEKSPALLVAQKPAQPAEVVEPETIHVPFNVRPEPLNFNAL